MRHTELQAEKNRKNLSHPIIVKILLIEKKERILKAVERIELQIKTSPPENS